MIKIRVTSLAQAVRSSNQILAAFEPVVRQRGETF